MRCNVCGADNLEGAAYCEDCGARLPMAAAQPTREAPAVAVSPIPVVAPTPVVEVAPPIPAPPAAAVPPPPPPVAAVPPPPPIPVSPPPVAAAPPSAGAPGVLVCPACGAQNLPGVAFCEDCGASLSETAPSSGVVVAPVNYDVMPVAPVPVTVAPPAYSARPRLVHTSGREFPLEKDTILLGRRSPVDGIFPEVDLTDYDTDSYISRRHGRITRNEAGYVYEDLGSSNGSWVNGNKLQAHVQQSLGEGISLRLGKTEMVVRLT